MPVQLLHEVYINSIQMHLPATLGTLSANDCAKIAANHGSPYTEDYHNVFAPLQPHVVRASLDELATDALYFAAPLDCARRTVHTALLCLTQHR